MYEFSCIYYQQAIDRTIDADVIRQQVHFQVVIAGFDVVECLIIDSQAALRFAGTRCTENMTNVSRTSQVSRIFQHRLKSRLSLHTSTDLHPTVASTQHHDDVIAMATRLKNFTVAIFDILPICNISLIWFLVL